MTTELERLVSHAEITLTTTPSKELPHNPYMQGWSAWQVTLKSGRSRMRTTFFTAPGYSPRAADVIATLCAEAKTLENTETFESWAMKYGYSIDSRAAFATWEDIVKNTPKIKAFLGKKYKQFSNARHA